MKALDSWARQFGYADFDTFVAAGGSILDAARDIAQRIRRLQDALKALPMDPRYLDQRAPYLGDPDDRGHTLVREPVIDPDTLERLKADADDLPADPENAQIQGAEHGEPRT
jgi:hypothetical protein